MKQSSILQGVAPKGSVLQVVSTTKTDTFSASTASEAFTAITGLAATITPVATSSTILVRVMLHASRDPGAGDAFFRMKRGATVVGVGDAGSSRPQLTGATLSSDVTDAITGAGIEFEDSPSTTSATTYSVELFNSSLVTRNLYCNRTAGDSDNSSGARPISTITLMEVAG